MGEGEKTGASLEEEEEAYKFKELVDEGSLTTAEVAQVEEDKTPEEIEAEKFRALTEMTMKKLKSIKEFNKNIDYPDEFHNLVQEIGLTGIAQMDQSRLLAAFLFDGKKNKKNPTRIDCIVPLEVLDVGGYDDDLGAWHNLRVFGFKENYTGISLDDNASYLYQKGTKINSKRIETLRMNVLDVDKEFHDRRFNFIIAQGFFGYPTGSSARAKEIDQGDYEEQILKILGSILEDGGIILLGSREWPAVNPDRIKEIGFDFKELIIFSYKTWILRKIPEGENAEYE